MYLEPIAFNTGGRGQEDGSPQPTEGDDERNQAESHVEPVENLSPQAMTELLETVFERCGFDFRDYAYTSLARRVKRLMIAERAANLTELRERVCDDDYFMERLLNSLTLPVTTMFRDPSFFQAFREKVCPMLATYPFIRLWVVGCSSGQEAYSLAIVLTEMGLYDRCRIYATDLHPDLLRQAHAGIYSLAAMQEYTRNYLAAGGSRSFTEYYTADEHNALFNLRLRANIVFASHNLTCDGSFNEFQAILCRNVMIYFNQRLQGRVHRLIYESLATLGYLGLGRSESIRFSVHESNYETVSKVERIYRKSR